MRKIFLGKGRARVLSEYEGRARVLSGYEGKG